MTAHCVRSAHQGKPLEYRAHLIRTVHIHIASEIRLQRVKHDQLCRCPADRFFQPCVAERQLAFTLVDDQHARASLRLRSLTLA